MRKIKKFQKTENLHFLSAMNLCIKNLGVADNIGELRTSTSFERNQDLRFGNVVFEKRSKKIKKMDQKFRPTHIFEGCRKRIG